MIGILDSGIGGLPVVSELQSLLPGYDMVYFGDTARGPYGDLSPETIMQFSEASFNFLVGRGALVIVIACSTISSTAAAHFQKTAPLPVLDAVRPAATVAATRTKRNRIGVIGTQRTIASREHEAGIKAANPEAEIVSAACPLLVPLIENGFLKRPETVMIVKKYVVPLKMRQVDTLILGCSHYRVIGNVVQRKMGKQVTLVDSVAALAASVRQYVKAHADIDRALGKNGRCRYYVSDITDETKRKARQIFHCRGTLEKAAAASI